MKITLKDIAEETGYSISTVSRVLNGSDKISAETRRAILHSAKKMNYPGLYSRDGGLLDTVHVTLVVTDYHIGEFYASFFKGMNAAAQEYDICLSMINIEKPVSRLIQRLRQICSKGNSDGVILFSPELTKTDYQTIREELPHEFPMLSNGLIECPILTTISFDSYSGGYMTAEHFLERGYDRCGIIRGPFRSAEARYRSNGFRDYILQHPEISITWTYDGDFSYESGVRAFDDYFTTAPRPRAIFACNDAMGHGFLTRALAEGYRVPEDVAVVGYDDLPICRHHRPAISSVHTNYKQLGIVTMDNLRERLASNGNEDGVLSLVPVKLIVRESS
ncbi:MAG: LacI family DNA-binding transcriptional regulator [Balneolaceae bacterium]|nr:LacI family DNA-binding transcriptional regulator [Balneolaceae bacterium]